MLPELQKAEKKAQSLFALKALLNVDLAKVVDAPEKDQEFFILYARERRQQSRSFNIKAITCC